MEIVVIIIFGKYPDFKQSQNEFLRENSDLGTLT